jgi:hypothetical protein
VNGPPLRVGQVLDMLEGMPLDAVCFFPCDGAWAAVRQIKHETEIGHYWMDETGATSAVVFDE